MIEILSDIIYFQRSQSRRMILPDTDYNSSPIDWCEDNYLYTPHVAGKDHLRAPSSQPNYHLTDSRNDQLLIQLSLEGRISADLMVALQIYK